MLENYEKGFDKDSFLQKMMEEGQLTKSKAVEACRRAIPREPYYQRKLLKGLKEKYPEAFVVKIAQGAYSQGGLPDILVILDGHYFGFEVKRPLIGEVSKLQEMTMARIRAAGGTAGVVSWPEEAIWVIERFTVPAWTKLLTGGVDVQQNCLYWTIRAWGDYLTSQNVAHSQAYSFVDIEDVMNMQYLTEENKPMMVCLCLIDSGFDADSVYDFCALNSDWALPCKGSSNPMRSHFVISMVNKDVSRAYGMNLILVDGGKYKDAIAARLHRENGRGSWMVYQGCDGEYAQQVTAEHKVNVKTAGGRTKQEWKLKYSKAQNHYLDCEVYAMAAADTLGLRGLHLQGRKQPKTQEKPDQYTPEETWIAENEDWI